jgi:hypothetical protein
MSHGPSYRLHNKSHSTGFADHLSETLTSGDGQVEQNINAMSARIVLSDSNFRKRVHRSHIVKAAKIAAPIPHKSEPLKRKPIASVDNLSPQCCITPSPDTRCWRSRAVMPCGSAAWLAGREGSLGTQYATHRALHYCRRKFTKISMYVGAAGA